MASSYMFARGVILKLSHADSLTTWNLFSMCQVALWVESPISLMVASWHLHGAVARTSRRLMMHAMYWRRASTLKDRSGSTSPEGDMCHWVILRNPRLPGFLRRQLPV